MTGQRTHKPGNPKPGSRKRGFYSQDFTSQELHDLQQSGGESLDQEIDLLRVAIRGLFVEFSQAEEVKVKAAALSSLSNAAARLARLMAIEAARRPDDEDALAAALQQMIEEEDGRHG